MWGHDRVKGNSAALWKQSEWTVFLATILKENSLTSIQYHTSFATTDMLVHIRTFGHTHTHTHTQTELTQVDHGVVWMNPMVPSEMGIIFNITHTPSQ